VYSIGGVDNVGGGATDAPDILTEPPSNCCCLIVITLATPEATAAAAAIGPKIGPTIGVPATELYAAIAEEKVFMIASEILSFLFHSKVFLALV
jgi:hypothetical protein